MVQVKVLVYSFLPPASVVEVIESVPSVCVCLSVRLLLRPLKDKRRGF